VVVRVRAAQVGWVDLLMTAGQYQHRPAPPYTPGLEYAGEVVACEGGAFAPGARVMSDGFLVGPRSSGAYQAYGGFATYALAPAAALRAIPGDLTFDEACNLLGNFETAYHCLAHRGRLQAGETVLILGASGATGLAAVQLAKLLGATVIAAGRSTSKLEVVRALGADHTLTGPLREQVKALTGGRGVDVVYDGVGGDASLEALRCVRFGARYLIVGWAATPGVTNQLPTNLMMMKGLDVLGCPTVIGTQNDPSIRPPRLAALLDWVERGVLRPHVSRTFPLAELREAMLAKWRGEVIGGCVLHP
jgi:NADPH2:quinone reductase